MIFFPPPSNHSQHKKLFTVFKQKTGCKTKDIRVLKDPRALALIFLLLFLELKYLIIYYKIESQDGKFCILFFMDSVLYSLNRLLDKLNRKGTTHVSLHSSAKALPVYKTQIMTRIETI